MLTLPSSRRLITPAICCLTVLAFSILLRQWFAIDGDILFEKLIQLNVKESREVLVEVSELSLEQQFLKLHYAHKPTTNPHIKRIFSNCNLRPNPVTSHIRLPNQMYNISMIPPGAENDSHPKQYFNPTVLPLHQSSQKTPYLLVSRLVTEGLHQESHMCLADLCVAPLQEGQSVPADSRLCTPADLQVLGPMGGMRCTKEPIKVNIPPTPAKHCSGAWAAFPDIPGFHDPRIFWSGRGGPLIMVNSASAYGCVGLWVMDLRMLFPALSDLLAKENEKRSRRSISYRHLTEITRNPRNSRSEVEKNWVMFFPARQESVVMYDLMGRVVETVDGGKNGEDVDRLLHSARQVGSIFETVKNVSTLTNSTILHRKRRQLEEGGDTPSSNQGPPEKRSDPTTTGDRFSRTVAGGRTLALMSSNGITTHNLTHPEEPPCFDLFSDAHLRDSRNNSGQWHQGSNALRLVLCTRTQMREKTYLPPLSDNRSDKDDDGRSGSHPNSEERLIQEGLVVHFSIVHRKFSNEMKLPMRYERYFVVWEARKPWRIIGVSKSPVLFADERARPWTAKENWPKHHDTVTTRYSQDGEGVSTDEDDRREAKEDMAYFTYSPSIAWAWKARSDILLEDSNDGGFDDLGTGFLGDDVLVGIGLDDMKQRFAKTRVEKLLQCLRICPGVDIED